MVWLRRTYACQECVELVTDYEDGALGRGERRRVERHLTECVECTEFAEQLRITVRTLYRMPPEPADPEVREQLLVLFRERRG